MGSTFNPQILADKLAKLNNTQQSIETLSHWCIFHMNKTKQVVETWSRQFHCSPREQRLAYLYLANDILQNSRRKGSEFVAEFWKVLPDALRDVIENGDEFAKNSARRLINIWDDRKVFGSRGHILKEEFVGRQVGSNNRNGKPTGLKLRPGAGNVLDKIMSGYQNVYGDNLDENAVLDRCRITISSIEKREKEFGGDFRSGLVNETGILDELKGHHSVLRECIQQLTPVESSRANLVTLLREALHEQELKLDQVHHQLQAAQFHSEMVGDILSDQGQKEISTSLAPQSFTSGTGEQLAPVMFANQVSSAETSTTVEGDNKSAAAIVAAKLAASTSSAEMLSFVLNSLASDGVIGNALKSDYPAVKRAKTENDNSSYMPMQNPQPGGPSFPQPEQPQHNPPATSQGAGDTNEKPPLPSSPPPMAPLPPMQPPYALPPYMQTAGSVPVGLYGYGTTMQQPPSSIPGYLPQLEPPMSGASSFAAPPPTAFQNYPTEGGFYGQSSSMPMAPINNRQ
ncbi:kinase inhibitor [Lithospermum erythrorhizon]|uniref:Kinase inhibitor n=1 Tax=Lithospermum erythrorhizon TaxID=34254 RepID=A0AAV3NSE2_LITER